MTKRNAAIISFLLVAIIVIFGLLRYFSGTPGSASYKESVYTLDDQPITMTSPGIKYFGNEAYGDLNGDKIEDVVFLFTYEPGGSGTFFYAVAALKTAEGYKGTNAFLVGDRIAPQNTEINSSTLHGVYSAEINVNFAQRRKGEPFTARPSEGAVLLLKVTKDGVLEGLMK